MFGIRYSMGGKKPPILLFMLEPLENKKMKLTESRIKQIILEELSALSEEEEGEQQTQAPKVQTDVENLLRLVPKIDNVKEYSELLTALMKHDFGDETKKIAVLKQLRNMINQLVK